MDFKERVQGFSRRIKEIIGKLEGLGFTYDDSEEKKLKRSILQRELKDLRSESEWLEFGADLENFFKVFHDKLPIIKEYIGIAQPEFIDCLKTVINCYLEVKQDLQKERKALIEEKTKTLHIYYQSLRKAGFSRRQSFLLIQERIWENSEGFLKTILSKASIQQSKKSRV